MEIIIANYKRNLFKLLFALLILPGFQALLFAQPSYPTHYADARFVSEDVGHFLSAMAALSPQSDTVAILQKHYIDQATPGLKEYISRFGLTATAIKEAMEKQPERYQQIQVFFDQIKTFEAELYTALQHYSEVIPNTMFPPTYFLVTDCKGIAQASKLGQLVSIEKRFDLDVLKSTVIHELTHFQQAMAMGIANYTGVYQKENNMLDLILREGGAEFITYNLVRNNEADFVKLRNYEKNELELWEKFKADLKKQDKTFWLEVIPNGNNGNPIQLGYGLGYKIVAAYYAKATDKDQALQDILNIKDANDFFEKSGYAPEASQGQP